MTHRIAWVTLLLSAFTDSVITAGTALMAVMTDSGSMPNQVSIVVIVAGGIVAMARTINQALKATPENTAALKGTGDGNLDAGDKG